MATTIAVLSQKGGTGKTTTVRNVADVLARVGAKTLAVDADPQGNLSAYFDVAVDAQPTLGEVLAGQAKAIDAIHRGTDGASVSGTGGATGSHPGYASANGNAPDALETGGVIPANLGLAEAELLLAGKIGREMTMRNALREAKRRYDFILIDCPPTLGLLTVNALVASDWALISTEAEHFSREGVEQALEVVGIARETLNPKLEPLGIVLNIADLRTRHARTTVERLSEAFPGLPFSTPIRRSIAYAESAELARPILDHRPSFGADYVQLTAEILQRLDEPGLADQAAALSAPTASN